MYTEKQIELISRIASQRTDFTLHESALFANICGKVTMGREAELTKEELAYLANLMKVTPAAYDKERGELTADVSAKAEALEVKA